MILYVGIMVAILLTGLIRVRFTFGNKALAERSADMGQQYRVEGGRQKRKFFVFFFLAVFWVLTAFRGASIGNDTRDYIAFYEETQLWVSAHRNAFWKNLFISDAHFELGYVVLCRLTALLLGDVQWLFIIVTTFMMIVLYKWIVEDSLDPVMSVYLFIALRFLFFIMTGIRQAMAMFLCVLAYRYIKKRKLIPFLLMMLLATQFHITSVVFLVAYPLSYFRFNKVSVFVTTIVGVVAFLLFDQLLSVVLAFLPEYYSNYEGSHWFAENKLGNMINAAIQLVVLCVSLFSTYRFQSKGKKNEIFTKEYDASSFMQFMMLMSLLMSVIALRATTLDRLSNYFWLFSIIYIPNVIQGIRRYTDRAILHGGAIIFTFLYNVTILYFRPEWNLVVPYKFFWQ